MNLLESLKDINPSFKELIVQEIKNLERETIAYKCFGTEGSGNVFCGGTANDQDTAIRIAVAEAFERSYLNIIAADPIAKSEFDLVNFPSSSGFAAGFDLDTTRFRAICEGVERWAWSKWIDDKLFIAPMEKSPPLSKLGIYLQQSFEQVFWYKKDFKLKVSNDESLNLQLVIFLGCKDEGIYPGSRVSTSHDNLLDHPIIEAHRNLTNAELNKSENKTFNDIIEQRTHYFATNKLHALKQMAESIKTDWPQPEIALLKRFDNTAPGVFLFRCLLKDFTGWHLGPIDRFIY